MKIQLLIILFLFGPSNKGVFAQSKGAEISFEHLAYDFGTLLESIGFAKHQYPFTNTGTQALFIQQVHTSCGCTTPDWTRDTILPGKTGFIEASYETVNRLGEFKKTITVYSNALSSPIVHLDIAGNVVKEEPSPFAAKIPDYGKLSLSQASFSFNPIFSNQTDTQTIRIINETPFTTVFTPIDSTQIPIFCKILRFPSSLEPNESGKLTLQIDAKKITHYGFNVIELPIVSDNPSTPYLGIYLNYYRKEYFPKMNAKQLLKQAKLLVNKLGQDFGKLEAGDILTTEFVFTNSGKSELLIHDISPDCGCITLKYPKKNLKPGESMTIKVLFNTVLKKGNANHAIWVVSNDPVTPERSLPIRAQFDKKVIECKTCPK